MMRVLVRGSFIYPAKSVSPKYPYQHVHGLMTKKDGKIRGLFVNDSPIENLKISLQSSSLSLPATFNVRTKRYGTDVISQSTVSSNADFEIPPLGFIELS
jgi:hypothetical protein